MATLTAFWKIIYGTFSVFWGVCTLEAVSKVILLTTPETEVILLNASTIFDNVSEFIRLIVVVFGLLIGWFTLRHRRKMRKKELESKDLDIEIQKEELEKLKFENKKYKNASSGK